MLRRTKTSAGFTLVELTVALGLTIFLLALFTTLMVAATGSINTSQGIGAVDQHVRNAITILRDDLKKVYIANDGTPISVSTLFTDATKIPTEGYFLVEENDRAIRQGLDSAGIPVEVDTDDVLAFTAGKPSASRREDFYYGRVYNNQGSTIVSLDAQGRIPNFGNYLDNSFNDPIKSFDTLGNNLISSKFAEIVYFLRPDKRQHSVNDIRGNFWSTANPATQSPTIPSLPATYTLYRRQLLVLENGERLNRGSDLAPNGVPLDSNPNPGNSRIPGRPNDLATFYDLFDISASREFTFDATGTPIWTFSDTYGNDLGRIHINTLSDLSKREYRYGMKLFSFAGFLPPPAPPLFRGIPLSHPAAQILTIPVIHDYRDIDPTNNPLPADDTIVPWFGRFTQAETNHQGYYFWPPPGSNQANFTDGNNNGVIDYADTGTPGQRYGDDVLLTNVVSFDIKVFEEVAVPPIDTIPSTYVASTSPSVNALDDVDLNASRGEYAQTYIDTTKATMKDQTAIPSSSILNSRLRRPEFVDLGYGYDRNNFFGEIVAADANCQTLNNYYYHPSLASFGIPFNPAFDTTNPAMDLSVTVDGIYFRNGVNNIYNDDDDFTTTAFPGNTVANYGLLRDLALGYDVVGTSADDDGDGVVDNISEYLAPFSNDVSVFIEAPYARSGQIGDLTLPGAWTHPRNTYDSWSESYGANPRYPLAEQTGGITATTLYPNFRPVPYPRPLKGIQIKLRVLEPKSGIVRDFTLRHYFD